MGRGWARKGKLLVHTVCSEEISKLVPLSWVTMMFPDNWSPCSRALRTAKRDVT